MTYFDNLLFTY